MTNWVFAEIEEIYNSRYILKSLIIKNLVGRYRNSVFGFTWHFITPAIILMVYYIVFSQIRNVDITDYWIYLSSGLFPFNYMLSNLTSGPSCLISNANTIKKIYFPREIIVLSQVISTFIVMLIGFSIIIVMVFLSGHGFGLSIIYIPVALLLTFTFVFGFVLLFSALTVYVRDVQHFISSISMIFFFLTPMYFLLDSITGIFKQVVLVNPFTHYVEAYHKIIYYQTFPDALNIVITASISVLTLVVGLFIFRKLKNGFVERL